MARIRSLKPEFWIDRKLARKLSRDARMLYLGLWNLSDEHARALGDPQYIKGQIFPYEDDLDPTAITALLDDLDAAGVVVRYVVDEDPYLYLPKLSKHQRLEPAKVASRLPAPPNSDVTTVRTDEFAPRTDETEPDAGKSPLLYGAGSMEQGAGGSAGARIAVPVADDPEPPLRCRKHLNSDDDSPCGACGSRRKTHEAWERRQATKPKHPPAPPWCGECDQDTRLIEVDNSTMARCKACHPKAWRAAS
jgi:hypothetical protein